MEFIDEHGIDQCRRRRVQSIFDAAAEEFRKGIETAALLLSKALKNKITVNIQIDCCGAGRGAAAKPDNSKALKYDTVVADLQTSYQSDVASLLPADQFPWVFVSNAQLKLFGELGANDLTTDDGSATFNTDIPANNLVSVALHELTHAIGRNPVGPTTPNIFDLFRYTSVGTVLVDGTIPGPGQPTVPAAYFSLDEGSTHLADYGTVSDPSDFLNSGVQGPYDAFNEYYDDKTTTSLSIVDLKQMQALGYQVASPTFGHLKFNLNWDPSVSTAPAGFKEAVEAVARYFEGRILDNVTLNVVVKYGALSSTTLGQSLNSGYTPFSYDAIRAAVGDDAATAADLAALLPAVDPITGQHTYMLDTAQQKALGLLAGDAPDLDGTVTFQSSGVNFDFDRSDGIASGYYDFQGTVAHELSEIMGRTMQTGGAIGKYPTTYNLLDLYHYSADGVRNLTKSPGYISIDGGQTKLNSLNFGAGDAADWAASAGNDAFLNNSGPGVLNAVSVADLTEMDVLGWDVMNEASTAAELSEDIRKIDLVSASSGGDGTNYVITLAPGAILTETDDLFAVNLKGSDTLTIQGNGATLDGQHHARGFLVFAGHVAIDDLIIANTTAVGGNGGFGGGGGAGLGGA